jgi:hypothetical protein
LEVTTHPSPKTLLIAAIVLVASVAIAQEATPSADAALMGRLSYDNSGFVQPGSVMHVCFAVYKDGGYRIVRSFNDGHTQRLHGNMPKEEFRQLSNLLAAAEFRNLSGNGGGLVRQEAETFAAEIALEGRWHDDGHGTKWLEPESWRLQWLNPDGETPFPTPIAKVLGWLKRFEPKNAKRFENTEFLDVCPSGGLRLVQPWISENLRP